MTIHIGSAVSLAGGVQFNSGSLADTVNLLGLPTNAPFTLTGTGQGSLTIGGANGLGDIHSGVTILAPVTLTADDRPDSLPAIYTLTATSLTFAHPSTITSGLGNGLTINMPVGPPNSLTIFGGNGGNKFLMPNGPPNFPNGTAVHGGGSADSLTITQPSDPTEPPWIITGTYVFVPNLSLPPLASGPGGATVTYDGLGSLVLNGPPGSTGFDVLSTAAGTATTINSQGTDTVTVGNNGSVQGILGPLSIDPANVSLVVDDSADPTARTVTLTPTQIIGLSPAVINYDSGVSNLTVDGGFGGNTFDVVNTSASAVTNVNSGAGNDFVNMLGVSNFLYIDGVAGNDVVTIGSLIPDAASFSSVEGGHATSSLPGGGTLANIQGPVIVHNSSGQTALIVDEAGVTAPVRPTALSLASPDLDFLVPATGSGNIYYNRTGQVSSVSYLGPQVGSSYFVYSTNGIPNTYLNLGPGNDTVDILATLGPLTINGGGGNDIVTIGGQFPIHGGGVSEIGPSIVLRNPTGTMALTVDDSNVSNTLDGLPNTMSRNATITGTSITGMPAGTTIDYTNANLTSLTILGGAGGNTFDVKNTPAGAVTTLDSGNGVDTVYVEGTTGPLTVNTQQSSTGPGFGGFEAVYVGKFTASGFTLDGIQGALTINTVARPGIDYGNLALYDNGATASQNYTMTSNTILRSGMAPIYYSVTNELFFYLGSGGNTFNVPSTHPGLAYAIFGGVGNDTFNIGDANGTLNGINYQLFISIQNPGSQVIVHDEGSSANYGYALASVILHPTIAINLPAYRILRSDWNQQGLGTAIWVTGPLYGTPPLPLQSLVLKAGSGNNSFNVQSLPPGNPTVTLDGGGGSNTLQGPNQNNIWQITSPNAGALDTNIRFGNIQNLIGGTANDVFAIRKDPFLRIGGSLNGTLNGGGGTDTLDYSGYTGDVTVNMRLGTATAVAGGISNIQNVTGSIGNDLIVGDANPHVFIGGTGRNIIIGGAGPDQITGGSGDNILIGGTTVWDANPVALQAIMQEWTNTSLTFDQRVNALRKGITVGGKTYALNTSTVIKDSSPDSLIGGGGQNWFFFDFDDIINNGTGPGPNDRTTKV
jgi:hypothetical protein